MEPLFPILLKANLCSFSIQLAGVSKEKVFPINLLKLYPNENNYTFCLFLHFQKCIIGLYLLFKKQGKQISFWKIFFLKAVTTMAAIIISNCLLKTFFKHLHITKRCILFLIGKTQESLNWTLVKRTAVRFWFNDVCWHYGKSC